VGATKTRGGKGEYVGEKASMWGKRRVCGGKGEYVLKSRSGF